MHKDRLDVGAWRQAAPLRDRLPCAGRLSRQIHPRPHPDRTALHFPHRLGKPGVVRATLVACPGRAASDASIALASTPPSGRMLTVIACGSRWRAPSETQRRIAKGRPRSSATAAATWLSMSTASARCRAPSAQLLGHRVDHPPVGEKADRARASGNFASSASRHAGSHSISIAPDSRSPTTQSPIASPSTSAPVMPKLTMPPRPAAAASIRARSPTGSPPPDHRHDPRLADDRGLAVEAGRDDSTWPELTCRTRPGAEFAALEVAVAGQRPEREVFRIAVIAQVEHARETAAGVHLLPPQPVRRPGSPAARRRRAPPPG